MSIAILATVLFIASSCAEHAQVGYRRQDHSCCDGQQCIPALKDAAETHLVQQSAMLSLFGV